MTIFAKYCCFAVSIVMVKLLWSEQNLSILQSAFFYSCQKVSFWTFKNSAVIRIPRFRPCVKTCKNNHHERVFLVRWSKFNSTYSKNVPPIFNSKLKDSCEYLASINFFGRKYLECIRTLPQSAPTELFPGIC